jgi:hypothetical protein
MPAIKITSDGKIIVKNGKPSCACCAACDGLPVPASQTIAVNDSFADTTHSGNVQSAEFPSSNLHCFVPKCRVIAGSQIDDFGTIGGVLFKNNVPCNTIPHPDGGFEDGQITTVLVDTDVAVTIVANKINVAWSATSDEECGQPTGLGNREGDRYCTFYFYWVRK